MSNFLTRSADRQVERIILLTSFEGAQPSASLGSGPINFANFAPIFAWEMAKKPLRGRVYPLAKTVFAPDRRENGVP